MRVRPFLAVLLVASCLPLFGQDAAPDPAALIKAAAETARRMEKDPCMWKTVHHINDREFTVETTKAGDRTRWVLSTEVSGRSVEGLRTVAIDGVWYVKEFGECGKYRPYEAPMNGTMNYALLLRSEARFVCAESLTCARFEKMDGHIACYRQPLPEAMRKQLEDALSLSNRVRKEHPEMAVPPDQQQAMAAARDLLEHGVELKVDAENGLMVQYGAPSRLVTIRDLSWLDSVPAEAFSVADEKWKDFTDDPLQGDPDDRAVLAHNGGWMPGMEGENDNCLVNLRTGRVRRIPFRGAESLTACFLHGREKVVVGGFDMETACIRPVEVDLRTGANRPLGGALLDHGFSMFPALSPDGKTIAAMRVMGGNILHSRLTLVDVASGEAREVGQPMDAAFVSWLPGGKGWILLHREPQGGSDQELKMVSRMDADGNLTSVVEGDEPLLLGDGARILYLAQGKELAWRTCGLDGEDSKPFGTRTGEYRFPALSPDGRSVMMMRYRKGGFPETVIIGIESGEERLVPLRPGMWAYPAWR